MNMMLLPHLVLKFDQFDTSRNILYTNQFGFTAWLLYRYSVFPTARLPLSENLVKQMMLEIPRQMTGSWMVDHVMLKNGISEYP